MPKGVVIQLDTEFPATFPLLLRDPMDAPGVLLIQDYANADSFPDARVGYQGGASPTRIYNLARRPGAVPHHDPFWDGKFIGNEGNITYNGKSLKFSLTNGSTLTNYLSATGDGSITPTLATNNFLVIIWARLGTATTSGLDILGSGGNQNVNTDPNAFRLFMLHKADNPNFIGTLALRNQAGVKIETGFQQTANGLEIDQLVQMAFFVQYGSPNSRIFLYRDGAQIRDVTLTGMTSMFTNNLPILVGAGGTAQQGQNRVHRLLVENIAVSGRSPLAVVNQDYLLNVGRFN